MTRNQPGKMKGVNWVEGTACAKALGWERVSGREPEENNIARTKETVEKEAGFNGNMLCKPL